MLRLNTVVPSQSKRALFGLGSSSNAVQSYKVSRKVSVPPRLLFKVVSDVSKYEEFVPFVTSSFIESVDERTNLPTKAGLRVGWKEFDEKFTCKLDCEENKSILAESITISLFEFLHTEWQFREIKTRFTKELATMAELTIRYKFKNPIYNTVSSLFQEQVSRIMVEAFENEALNMKIREKLKDRLNN